MALEPSLGSKQKVPKNLALAGIRTQALRRKRASKLGVPRYVRYRIDKVCLLSGDSPVQDVARRGGSPGGCQHICQHRSHIDQEFGREAASTSKPRRIEPDKRTWYLTLERFSSIRDQQVDLGLLHTNATGMALQRMFATGSITSMV